MTGVLPTGVPGLDTVLGGGLEPGMVIMLSGAPGTGKTILAQQICFAAATAERRAVYYTTMSEPHAKLVSHLSAFDFFEPVALGSRVEYLHLGDLLRAAESGSLEPMVTEVVRKTVEESPAVVVLDSVKALRDFAEERLLRLAFYDLVSRLAHTDTVLVLAGEYWAPQTESFVEFALADGIVQLEYEAREPVDRRWMRVLKMRGRRHLSGKHTFTIDRGGLQVYPRTETILPVQGVQVTGRVASGTPRLDQLMGGGIGVGDATVVLGPSGIGKTIFGLSFVAEGLKRGETCLYVTFQDTAEQLIKMASSFGWDLNGPREEGRLNIHHVPIGQLDLDMLTHAIRTSLDTGQVSRVVIDSLAELAFAAREQARFPAYARSLTALVRAAGASLVVTSETTTLGPTVEPVGGLTFLFHNVLLLRYIEWDSKFARALGITKMRNSNHDKSLYKFDITNEGLMIQDKLEDITGVLGWSALHRMTEDDLADQ